jgi:hypothetical protein
LQLVVKANKIERIISFDVIILSVFLVILLLNFSLGAISANVLQLKVVPPSAYLNVRMSTETYKAEMRCITFRCCYAMPSQVLGDVPTSPCCLKVFFYWGLFCFRPKTQNLKKISCGPLLRVGLSKRDLIVWCLPVRLMRGPAAKQTYREIIELRSVSVLVSAEVCFVGACACPLSASFSVGRRGRCACLF